MICCEAPDDATTKEMLPETEQTGSVRETYAADIRGGFFKYVHRYVTWDKPTYLTRRKVAHTWFRDGQKYGLWHYRGGHR